MLHQQPSYHELRGVNENGWQAGLAGKRRMDGVTGKARTLTDGVTGTRWNAVPQSQRAPERAVARRGIFRRCGSRLRS